MVLDVWTPVGRWLVKRFRRCSGGARKRVKRKVSWKSVLRIMKWCLPSLACSRLESQTLPRGLAAIVTAPLGRVNSLRRVVGSLSLTKNRASKANGATPTECFSSDRSGWDSNLGLPIPKPRHQFCRRVSDGRGSRLGEDTWQGHAETTQIIPSRSW